MPNNTLSPNVANATGHIGDVLRAFGYEVITVVADDTQDILGVVAPDGSPLSIVVNATP